MKTNLALIVLTALQCQIAAACGPIGKYVAHEWGTFTSVQGADGVQLEWNPLITSELPKFVYDQTKLAAAQGRLYFPGKSGLAMLQRLETPVIYFYSDQEQTVDVTVNFPQGIVTEWYPQITRTTPAKPTEVPRGPKVVRWEHVRALPSLQNDFLSELLAFDKSGSHYYHARETEADFLQVDHPEKSSGPPQTEKFLFYRGVGNFSAPLTVTQGLEGEYLVLHNKGTEELRHLFIYLVREGQGKYLAIDRLSAGENRSITLEATNQLRPLAALRADLSARLTQALVEQGLYEREARAMVRTWDDSWFSEPGVRVLYTLPRAWTDRILPLTLEPKPRELARVMVGRAELITPPMEWELLKQVVRFTDRDERIRARAVEDARKLGLGRFLEPTTRRLGAKIPSREFSQASWELLRAASKPTAGAQALAVHR